MKQYKELVQDILENGTPSDDRTGTGTLSVFGRQMRFDLQKGFPLVTLKKTWWKGVLVELLWMMHGDTNVKFLQRHGVKIWDEWADQNGDLGPVYGYQWRYWATEVIDDKPLTASHMEKRHGPGWHFDQLKTIVKRIKTNPNCRRLIISAWNAPVISEMALPPCHMFFQFYVRDGKLSCQMYQRSADVFLGVPFNIASYALLTHLVAKECGLQVGEFVHTFGDVHIYNNHIEQAKEMVSREPLKLPKLTINIPKGALFKFIDVMVPYVGEDELCWEDISGNIELTGYKSHATIKAEISV